MSIPGVFHFKQIAFSLGKFNVLDFFVILGFFSLSLNSAKINFILFNIFFTILSLLANITGGYRPKQLQEFAK